MNEDRRKYFRIQDSVMIRYRVISEVLEESAHRDAELNQIKIETARAALFGIETDFQELCGNLALEQPATADVLQMLNRKINLLERVISGQVLHASPSSFDNLQHETKLVDLSGGGMSFTADHRVESDARLIIDLVLLPSHDPMRVFGKIVHCQPVLEDQYRLGVEFTEISNQDRERLVRHTLQRQAEQIRLDKIAEAIPQAPEEH
ncbi:MAG: PilZ domain-containing protein [Pseudomonadota bacterium]